MISGPAFINTWLGKGEEGMWSGGRREEKGEEGREVWGKVASLQSSEAVSQGRRWCADEWV